MASIHAKQALLPEGWAEDVRVSIEGGRIVGVGLGASAGPDDDRAQVLLPGMANLHSHAFQRAMAGLAEMRGPGADSFWSWRETMYRFAHLLSPEDAEAVAAQAYAEMLEAGFTRVGEFHYLHHTENGRPYANPAEMAERITAAANETGIGLTLLPVFYARSGFGGTPPTEAQRRFVSALDLYAQMLEGSAAALRHLETGVLGAAPHSLRAVTPKELAHVTAFTNGPIHIHVAEQVREVEDCVAWSGARPVEWLLGHAEADRRWCLIHATHMTEAETRALARSGAVAGLCPETEANLGDGIFPAPLFLEAGGAWGVGTDSNVRITLSGELRQLEYSQRLGSRARNVVAEPGGSTGRKLFDGASAGGAQALGWQTGIVEGCPADLVSLSPRAPVGLAGDALLDRWIFADGAEVDRVWVVGRKLVEGGRHHARERIAQRFAEVMDRLARL